MSQTNQHSSNAAVTSENTVVLCSADFSSVFFWDSDATVQVSVQLPLDSLWSWKPVLTKIRRKWNPRTGLSLSRLTTGIFGIVQVEQTSFLIPQSLSILICLATLESMKSAISHLSVSRAQHAKIISYRTSHSVLCPTWPSVWYNERGGRAAIHTPTAWWNWAARIKSVAT